MSRIGKYTHVYYSNLKCEDLIKVFADEIHKKKFLDIICQVQKKLDFGVYAYCILDNEIHLLLGTESIRTLSAVLKQLIGEFSAYPEGVYQGQENKIKEMHQNLKIKDFASAMEYCRRIHLIPVQHQVVRRPGDYWWSSYNEYIGKSNYGIVNTDILMAYLDMDKQAAVKKFKGYHNRQIAKVQ